MDAHSRNSNAGGRAALWMLAHRFLACPSGTSTLEYGLVASIIAVTVVVAMKSFGTALEAAYAAFSFNFSLDQ